MLKSVLVGAAVLGVALAASPVRAELKIGYVNYAQLLQASPQAKAIAEKLRMEFVPRQRQIQNKQDSLKKRADDLQKNAATMTDEQRDEAEKELRDGDRDLQAQKSELQDDFNARRNEELSRLQRDLIEQVRTYAKAQNFDLVLADGVIYWTSAIDITPAILNRLEQTAHAGGAGAGTSRAVGSDSH